MSGRTHFDDELVTCLECGAQFLTISSTHLKRKHGLTFEQYRETHPGALLNTPQSLKKRGQAIAKGWTPGVKARMRKQRRALFYDAVRGKKTREALDQGRADSAIRAKAKATMRRKAATDPTYGATMGKISREGWAADAPTKRADRIKNMQLAQSDPERRARQSEIATELWRKRKTELERLRALENRSHRGPTKKESEKTYFQIGEKVEQGIPADQKQTKRSIVSAREAVAIAKRMQFEVVAQYHKRYRNFLKSNPV